jgi:hypothetical protein
MLTLGFFSELSTRRNLPGVKMRRMFATWSWLLRRHCRPSISESNQGGSRHPFAPVRPRSAQLFQELVMIHRAREHSEIVRQGHILLFLAQRGRAVLEVTTSKPRS